MIIYHIITEKEHEQLSGDYYKPYSLERDAFIHLSLKEQVSKVANSLYDKEPFLYILNIDTNRLKYQDKLVFEDLYELNEDYPHYYGPLNTSSIIKIERLEKRDDTFEY